MIDTDLLIELMRDPISPEAERWFSTLDEIPSIHSVVAAEVRQGARNAEEKRRIEEFLAGFPRVRTPEGVVERAEDTHSSLVLSVRNLGIRDSIIAETAKHYGATLYTLNERHFRHVPDLSFFIPYQQPPSPAQERDRRSVSFLRWGEDEEGIYGVVRITDRRHERYRIDNKKSLNEMTYEEGEQLVAAVQQK